MTYIEVAFGYLKGREDAEERQPQAFAPKVKLGEAFLFGRTSKSHMMVCQYQWPTLPIRIAKAFLAGASVCSRLCFCTLLSRERPGQLIPWPAVLETNAPFEGIITRNRRLPTKIASIASECLLVRCRAARIKSESRLVPCYLFSRTCT